MQLQYSLILSSLATAISAVSTCTEGAPYDRGFETFWFARQQNGIHVASFRLGYASYAAPSLNSKQGVLQIVNEATERKSVCLMKTNGVTCYWLNGGDTCKTNVYITPNMAVLVGNV